MSTVDLMAEAIKAKAAQLGVILTAEEAGQLAEAARAAIAANISRTTSKRASATIVGPTVVVRHFTPGTRPVATF